MVKYLSEKLVALNINGLKKSYMNTDKQLYRVRKSWSDVKSQLGAFSSLDNANSYMVLFASYNNFLRPNKALDWNIPIQLNGISNMPNK